MTAQADQIDVRLAFVLDDEARVGAALCKMLAALGIEARQFTVPAEFLAELKTRNPDLVLLDLALGQTDAIDVIHALEACAYRGRLLLVSGRDSATLMEVDLIGRSHGLTMLPPLPKPFELDDLRHCLQPLSPLQPALPDDEGKSRRKPYLAHLGSKA